MLTFDLKINRLLAYDQLHQFRKFREDRFQIVTCTCGAETRALHTLGRTQTQHHTLNTVHTTCQQPRIQNNNHNKPMHFGNEEKMGCKFIQQNVIGR